MSRISAGTQWKQNAFWRTGLETCSRSRYRTTVSFSTAEFPASGTRRPRRCGAFPRPGEYQRGDIHQDDRCRTEIDGETKPPRCRDSAQNEGERAHRQVAQEIERGEYAAAVALGSRRADHLQAANK